MWETREEARLTHPCKFAAAQELLEIAHLRDKSLLKSWGHGG
jgi:hypothetical protein